MVVNSVISRNLHYFFFILSYYLVDMIKVFAHEWLISTNLKFFFFYFQVPNVFEDNTKTAARGSKLKPRGLFKDGIQINPEVYGKHD